MPTDSARPTERGSAPATAARRLLNGDGQVVTIGGRDFAFSADEGGAGWTCCTCGAYVGFGDEVVNDHVCEAAS